MSVVLTTKVTMNSCPHFRFFTCRMLSIMALLALWSVMPVSGTK